MKVLDSIASFRAARAAFPRLGLVPTMGYLHEGHLSLVRRARAECGAVAASIFVNPLQFAAGEDFARYPRDMARDLALLADEGVDLVFTPTPEILYPPGFASQIDIGPMARVLEGAARPGHFVGVATVVAKLLSIVQPERAYFGQKDGQQCAVIQRLVDDLNLPVSVVIAATVRAEDGLALSSRNVYLTAPERQAAPVVYRALRAAEDRFTAGERQAEVLRAAMRAVIAAEPLAQLDYVSVAALADLAECGTVTAPAMASLAVQFGRTRLIDNVILGAEPG